MKFSKANTVQRSPFGLVLIIGVAPFTGCAVPELHMMLTRNLFKDERLGFMPHLRSELRSTTLPAFYAAFRKALSPRGPGHSADQQGDGVRMGVAEVRLGASDWNWDASLLPTGQTRLW